jgi:ankyrin repeat protein
MQVHAGSRARYVNSQNKDKQTAVHWAMIGNAGAGGGGGGSGGSGGGVDKRYEACKLAMWLLANGGDPNKQDSQGNTPLHLAVIFNRVQLAEILIRSGSNISITNDKGVTPLQVRVQV